MDKMGLITKRILTFALSITVVGGASAIIYASQNNDASTKNVVLSVQNQQVNKNNAANGTINDEKAIQTAANGTINDEKAIQTAVNALKDYMGVDASMYSETSINRRNPYDEYKKISEVDKKRFAKMRIAKDKNTVSEEEVREAEIKYEESLKTEDNIVEVNFTNAGQGKELFYSFVEIDEITGEILNVTVVNDLDLDSPGKIDDAKVKSVSLDFLKKIGKDADVDSISISNDNGPLSCVKCKLKGGSTISLEVCLNDYTCMHYQNYSNIHNKK